MRIPLLRGRNLQPATRRRSSSASRSRSANGRAKIRSASSSRTRHRRWHCRQRAMGARCRIRMPWRRISLPRPTTCRAGGAREDVGPAGERGASVVASIAKALDPESFPEVRLLKTSFRKKLRETRDQRAVGDGAWASARCCWHASASSGSSPTACRSARRRSASAWRWARQGSHVLSVVLRQLSRPVVAGLLLGIGAAARVAGRCAASSTASATWIGRIRGCHRRVRRGRRARSPVAREPRASRRSPAGASVRLTNPNHLSLNP